eukprot:11154587-Lingulodinium_polyedra.AAC.1
MGRRKSGRAFVSAHLCSAPGAGTPLWHSRAAARLNGTRNGTRRVAQRLPRRRLHTHPRRLPTWTNPWEA